MPALGEVLMQEECVGSRLTWTAKESYLRRMKLNNSHKMEKEE